MSSPFDNSTGAAATSAVTLEALAGAGEQSGWRVLDTARALKFTGEIVFQTEPTISVYFDAGTAYYAVRAGDPSLCDRLIEVGVVEPAQVERGVIRVGNVENLGRLFDRDPSVDRDAVMVVLEIATDDVVSSVANTVTSSFTSTAYRHHASGVHRWFVAPSDREQHAPTQLAPVGEVAQIDASVTSDLPGLAGLSEGDDDGIHIEWDQPLGDDHLDAPAPLHGIDESMLQSMLDTATPPIADAPTAEVADVGPADIDEVSDTVDIVPAPPLAPPSPDLAVSAPLPDAADDDADLDQGESGADNFQIVWPDGSEQALLGPDSGAASAAPEFDETTPPAESLQSAPSATTAANSEMPLDEPSGADDWSAMPIIVPADEVVASAPDAVPFSFELPALAVSNDNVPDDHQPEEVVDAVRRALEAIESASAAPTRLPSAAIADLPSFEPTTRLEFDVMDLADGEPAPSDATSMPAEVEPTPVADRPLAALPDPATAPLDLPIDAPLASLASLPSVSALESALPPLRSTELAGKTAELSGPVVERAAESTAEATPAPTAEAAPAPTAEAAPAPTRGFAAPTMDDSAEAVYARAAEAAGSAGPASGVASVVFVDEEPDTEDERSSALKRLIGSLRRK